MHIYVCSLYWFYRHISGLINNYFVRGLGERSTAISVSVCLFVRPPAHFWDHVSNVVQFFCVLPTQPKKTNEWVLNKAGVKRELLDTVKARKLAYYGHTMRKQGSCLEKEIIQGTMPGACRRGRPHTAWMNNIKTWTGLSVEESIRMKEDRDKWKKYVHGVANPRIEDG